MTNERDKIMRMSVAMPALPFWVESLLVVGPTLSPGEGKSTPTQAAGAEASEGADAIPGTTAALEL